jgi:hypothetical protein
MADDTVTWGRSAQAFGGLSGLAARATDRYFIAFNLPRDRYGVGFAASGIGLLLLTLAVFTVIGAYWDLNWLASEDGVSEWSTVVLYVASGVLAWLTAARLRRRAHRRLALFHAAIAVTLVLAALEEISWGQRIFDWSTPAALAAVNYQNETTLHNLSNVDRITNTIMLTAAAVAIAGAFVRSSLHRRGIVTTADFVFPTLTLVLPLVAIFVWIGGGDTFRSTVDLVARRPEGDEAPEVITGVVLLVYTWGNFARARMLARLQTLR